MNREEAIEALTRIKWVYVGNELFEAEKEQAIEIAIEALECKPSDDGTLEVKVEDATKVGRVLITDGKHRGGLYYPDEDEPKRDDLISRADAIEAMGEEPLVWCDEEYEIAERNQWREDVEAIESVPSADRPRGEWINTALSDRSDNIICDQCGYNSIARYDFCPNCGADMRGENK